MILSQAKVTILLKRVKISKAAGPDSICGRTLRHCADQLSEVFSLLFQMCVESGQLPTMWKTSTIIPVSKARNPRELNEFRPVALTSLVMKVLEKILKDEITTLVNGKLGPLQFAYQPGKGVDDAKIFILDRLYKHLEKPSSHARLLFADFSSAFNKMQAHILIERLASYFDLPVQILLLLLNFLTDRIQRVFVNGHMSTSITSSTGSPQGCVLSPLLFIMCTDCCGSFQVDSHLVKFSDDTALLSLLQGAQSDHVCALSSFVEWCDDKYLDLNSFCSLTFQLLRLFQIFILLLFSFFHTLSFMTS